MLTLIVFVCVAGGGRSADGDRVRGDAEASCAVRERSVDADAADAKSAAHRAPWAGGDAGEAVVHVRAFFEYVRRGGCLGSTRATRRFRGSPARAREIGWWC